ncbi:MAG TPA: type II toxin-antitoxin system MqsA family antitoxin [Clostridiaceae bacterium]|nr:type II toxin-antitoxin system MqsA family antitoxin [Clostridiaceae bacterium]
MSNYYSDKLMESLDQALEYSKGNKKTARSVVRSINIPAYKAADVVATRKKLRMTQRALANAVGVSVRTVEAWEAGNSNPSGAARHMLYLLSKDEKILDLLMAT